MGLLEKLPAMFASTQSTEVALGPALKAAYQLMQHIGGKLSVFSATRPTVGDAKLKARGEGAAAKAAADGKGPNLMQPDCDFYKNLAVDGSKQQVCIDVWSCAGSYTDLATIGQLAKHTSGSVYHYPRFSDQVAGERLSRDLQHNLTRAQGWEAVMRVRVSRGLRISNFYGHFFIRGTDLLALPNIDEDKTFAVEIAHEENALSASTCCMQAALLYTTSSGERRIRVHTTQLPVTSGLSALYESADVDACTNLIGRVALETAMTSSLVSAAEKLQNTTLELLRAYRAICPPQAKTCARAHTPPARIARGAPAPAPLAAALATRCPRCWRSSHDPRARCCNAAHHARPRCPTAAALAAAGPTSCCCPTRCGCCRCTRSG